MNSNMQPNQPYKQKRKGLSGGSRAIFSLGLLVLFCIFYQVHAQSSEDATDEDSFWEKIEEKVEAFLGIELDNDDVEFGKINKASANNPEIQQQEKSKTKFSFAVVGDTQGFLQKGDHSDFAQAISSIKKENPDLLMTVGDLTPTCNNNSQCISGYEKWKNTTESFERPVYEVMGNHDQTDGKESRQVWQESFDLPQNGPKGYEEIAYSFDYGSAHFVVLADYPSYHKIDKKQLNWLEKDLDGNSLPNIFVFFHEPAYPAAYKESSALDAKKKDRDEFWSILDQHNVTAVFNGHEHMFSLKKIDDKVDKDWESSISQAIVGQTDAYDHKEEPKEGSVVDYYNGKDYVLVKVDGEKVNLELHSIDGKLINSYDISK